MNNNKFYPSTLMPDDDWWHALWPTPLQVMHDIGIRENMSIIDICCGDGYFTKALCELSKTGQVIGLDLDSKLINKAKKRCSDLSNFQAISGNAQDLPSHINSLVDFVLIANTFHGVPNQNELSQIIHNTLNETGSFAIINWYPLPREQTIVLEQARGPETSLRMHPEDVKKIVEPVGFRLNKMVDVSPYHYAIVFNKIQKKRSTK